MKRFLSWNIDAHRRCRRLLAVLVLTAGLAATAASAEDRAEVSLTVNVDDAPWTGEQTTLNLDLKTPALSFAEIHFDLPEVAGALLLRTDSTTVKLSERRGGETWQVLRYPITLFPQQAGDLTVPPFEVRFRTRAGFGTEPTSHRLETAPLQLVVRQPPGLEPGKVVVTTPDHSVTANWTLPQQPVRAGDAITLTVERRAARLSAMLLPALPVFEAEGLAAYPAAPLIDDRTNRGSLVGERTDRITWIVERPGDYRLPTVAFRWWDPVREALNTDVVDGVVFTAEATPGQPGAASAGPREATPGRAIGISAMHLALGAITVLLIAAALRFRRQIGAFLSAARRRIFPPARALLKTLNPGASS